MKYRYKGEGIQLATNYNKVSLQFVRTFSENLHSQIVLHKIDIEVK